jgi:hypothetical protein
MGLSSSSLIEVCPSNSLCWFLPMYRAYVRHRGSESQDTPVNARYWCLIRLILGETLELPSMHVGQPGRISYSSPRAQSSGLPVCPGRRYVVAAGAGS